MSEVKVCELTRLGRTKHVKVTTSMEDLSAIIDTGAAMDYFIIINECVNHLQSAWYFKPEKDFAGEFDEVEFVNMGKKSLRERLAEAYQEKSKENLVLLEDFKWVDAEADDFVDKER